MKPESDKLGLRERNRLRTTEDIVARALELFQSKGFDNVTVEELCDSVGLSRATFFNYFPQKELIFTAVAQSRLDFSRRFIAEHLADRHEPAVADIVEVFVAISELNERQADRIRFVLPQVLFRPVCREFIRGARSEAQDLLAAFIARIPDGPPPQTAAETVFSIHMGTLMEWITSPDAPSGWLVTRVRERLELALGLHRPT